LAAKILHTKSKKRGFSHKKARRQRVKAFLLLIVLFAALLAAYFSIRSLDQRAAPSEGLSPNERYHRLGSDPLTSQLGAPDPPELTLAGYAYESVASELPDAGPEDIDFPRQSVIDTSWASVRVAAPGRKAEDYYAVFLHKKGDEWRAERSVLIESQDHPRDVETLLGGIPEDLVNPLFPPDDAPKPANKPDELAVQVMQQATGKDDWKAVETKNKESFYKVTVESKEDKKRRTNVYLKGAVDGLKVAGIGEELTGAELPGFPRDLVKYAAMAAPDPLTVESSDPVLDGKMDQKRVEPGLEQASQTIRGYGGTAGFYAMDTKTGSGFGIRPDEPFFSASTIKVPVMIAVYRRIDESKLSYSDTYETTDEDWAAGAGWLRWDTPGAKTTVEDALWLMITQSDNVATNSLVRKVGGPGYVNEVARSLGADNTALYEKLSSERAAVPSLDDRTTPRDMATMLQKIASHKAASDFACKEMIGLLEQNSLEYWMEAGVPQGIPVANKGGWLDATYNDVGIVEYEGHPYVLAVYTKYGPESMIKGETAIQNISKATWLAESGKTVKQYEKEQKEKSKQKEQKAGEQAKPQHQEQPKKP